MSFMDAVARVAKELPLHDIERLTAHLNERKGRSYIIGFGGSLANAVHMAADLRKICDVDAEAFDNIAEFSARVNDDGVDHVFDDWLKRATDMDTLIVLSVGGGTNEVSVAILNAVMKFPGTVVGIVGPNGGMTAQRADIVIKIPAPGNLVTPLTEAFQAVIWHCLVSDPLLQRNPTKW